MTLCTCTYNNNIRVSLFSLPFSLSPFLSLPLSLPRNSTPLHADVVNNVNAFGARPPAAANITWDALSPFPSPPASGYQVVYRLLSSTIVQFKDVDFDESQTTLTGLQDYSMYEIYVRVMCSDGGVGPLSDAATLMLVHASELCSSE